MIIQDDNFITAEQAQNIKDLITSIPEWLFREGTQQDSGVKLEEVKTDNRFGAIVTPNSESITFVQKIAQGSPALGTCLELLSAFCTKHSIQVTEILRIKSNILPQSLNDGYHSPHVDQDTDHKVFLYYVNDSDGDTVFFKQFWNGQDPTPLVEDIRVAPKMGRGVVFDGLQYHCSTSPIHSNYRCVINIDFK